MNRRVLVTGAAGFIGSTFVDYLLARGDVVVGLDNFSDNYLRSIKERNLALASTYEDFHMVEGDILDGPLIDKILDQYGCDFIVHLAAKPGVRPSVSGAATEYARVNVEGTAQLLERVCRRDDVFRGFVFASSSSVYGVRDSVLNGFDTTDRVESPQSPYAASKIAGELMCRAYHNVHGLDVAVLRLFTVYGLRQRPDMAISKFTRRILAGQTVDIYGDGSALRDFTHVDDVVRCLGMTLDAFPAGYNVYNVGSGRVVSVRDVVELISRYSGRAASESSQPAAMGDVPRTRARVDRTKSEIGFSASIPLEDGLKEYVGWRRYEEER